MRLVFERPLPVANLSAQIAHPVVRPRDLDRYLRKLYGGRADAAFAFTFHTIHGWPACLLSSPRKLAVRYEILHLVAGVTLYALGPEGWSDTAVAVEAFLRSARPDFRDELPCVGSIWSETLR